MRAVALPDRIGPYRPLRLIGAGGMGTVYYCLRPGTGQPLAVKVLHSDWAQGAQWSGTVYAVRMPPWTGSSEAVR